MARRNPYQRKPYPPLAKIGGHCRRQFEKAVRQAVWPFWDQLTDPSSFSGKLADEAYLTVSFLQHKQKLWPRIGLSQAWMPVGTPVGKDIFDILDSPLVGTPVAQGVNAPLQLVLDRGLRRRGLGNKYPLRVGRYLRIVWESFFMYQIPPVGTDPIKVPKPSAHAVKQAKKLWRDLDKQDKERHLTGVRRAAQKRRIANALRLLITAHWSNWEGFDATYLTVTLKDSSLSIRWATANKTVFTFVNLDLTSGKWSAYKTGSGMSIPPEPVKYKEVKDVLRAAKYRIKSKEIRHIAVRIEAPSAHEIAVAILKLREQRK